MKAEQGAQQMSTQSRAYHWIPWAWSLAWLLAGMGIWLSDLYSSPSRSLGPYFALSALGWVIAGFVTARAVGSKPGTVVRLIAWGLAGLAAVLLGFIWLHGWNMAFFGPIVATGVAGVIGGLAGSMRPGAWRLVSAILLGAAFLLFAFFSFCFTYFLMLVATSIAQQGGDITVLNALLWLLSGATCGLGAGFSVRWILGLKKPEGLGGL
jgi:hypothetical protein